MSDPTPKSWNSVQAYTLAAICLLLGTVIGYLSNSPANARTGGASPMATSRQPQPFPKPAMPDANDMKRMADKQVAPLLAELQNNPKDADLLEKIGRSYMAAQQYVPARQYLEQSVSAKPNPAVLNELAFVYYSLGDADRAIQTLNSALKLDPKNPKLLFNLGMFEWHGRSDPQAAIAAWERFVKANPNDPKRGEAEKMIAQAKQHLGIAPGTKTDKPTM